jgi:hypothetical protein
VPVVLRIAVTYVALPLLVKPSAEHPARAPILALQFFGAVGLALPWPELALLAGCVKGTLEEAAAAWLATVRGDGGADAVPAEDHRQDGAWAEGVEAAPPPDEGPTVPSPGMPLPHRPPDGATPIAQGPDEQDTTAAHPEEPCAGSAAAMPPSVSPARAPEAGPEHRHVGPGERDEASTPASANMTIPSPDVNATAVQPHTCRPSAAGAEEAPQASPTSGAEASPGVGGLEADEVGPDGAGGSAPDAGPCAPEAGGAAVPQLGEPTPAQRVGALRKHLVAQIWRFQAEGASGSEAFVRRLNEAGELTPGGKGPWDHSQYTRFARQYGLPM